MSYKILEQIFTKLNDIEQAQSVLHWDMATYMPSGGAEARGNQLGTLESIHHALLTDSSMADLFAEADNERKKLNFWQKSNLFTMKHRWKHASAVPSQLASALAIAGAKCQMVWREARPKNDFKSYQKELEKVVSLVREVAKTKGKALKCSPYEALLDQFDPGRKVKELDAVFADLEAFLPDFTKEVMEKQKKQKIQKLDGPFAVEQQKELANTLLTAFQFDFNKGRLDESAHPFCGGYPTDVRITSRYLEDDALSGMMAIMHEAGHADYEANLPAKWAHQPVGKANGMAIHESQSLAIEMQACRSPEFMEFLSGAMKKAFNKRSKAFSAENLTLISNKVEPSLIRVDADEVTYPAHVMLRYHIEKFLIEDDMDVADLPIAWAQGMEKFLEVKPDNDKDGCMQDIHWTDGSFGYFPTYSLGAIYAAQLFRKAKEDHKEIPANLKKGDFSLLKNWLKNNIHEHASSVSTAKLIEKATGSKLDVEGYKAHLKERYLAA